MHCKPRAWRPCTLYKSCLLYTSNKTYEGKTVFINGEFRSRNTEDGKLALYVFVHEIEIFDELDGGDTNMIILNGYLCKKPTYRKTPYGREISDLFIAVYRHTGKSDYIPCVAWGRNAKFASEDVYKRQVVYDGNSYAALKTTTGNTPTDDSEYWKLLVRGGSSVPIATEDINGVVKASEDIGVDSNACLLYTS